MGRPVRQRLQSLSWFMKCLKEPLARMANREDKVRGAFFEERFKSIAIADEQALLAVCVYIDLNPVAAGIAPAPEKSDHTSVKQRIEHVEAQGRTAEQVAAPELSVEASAASGGLEESLWLCPIEDRRGLDSSREGMFVGFPLKSYLLLVDYTGRFFREGKARISADLAGFLNGWVARPTAGGPDSKSCAAAAGLAASSRRPATACRSSPTASAYAGWPIWGDARRDETSDWLKRDATASQATDWFAPTKPR